MGSLRGRHDIRYLSESMLTASMAFLFSLILVGFLLPHLKDLGFENITLSLDNGFLLSLGFMVCIITGLIAGSYPALYLSSFLPVKVLKGIFKQGKSPVIFRRLLVVFQFNISIGLIVSILVVFHQLKHVYDAKNRTISYNHNNLISIKASRDIYLNFKTLKEELLNSEHIEAVATASSPMTAVYNKWSDFSWDGKDPNAQIALEAFMTE